MCRQKVFVWVLFELLAVIKAVYGDLIAIVLWACPGFWGIASPLCVGEENE